MIFDANNTKQNIPSSEICIIGSGIAASILALELLDSDISFVMIEAGDFTNPSSDAVERENVGRDFVVEPTTATAVGGTSSLWHGVIAPLDKLDFAKRKWVPHSGWPITYTHLQKYYEAAGKRLFSNDLQLFKKHRLPHKLFTQLSKLKFNRDILENKIFLRPIPVTRFKDILRKRLSETKNAHIFYNLCGLEFSHGDSKRVNHLICGNNRGERLKVTAKTFVICCGALETPRLLLNSGFKNKNLGKFLMDHPMGTVSQIKFSKKQNLGIYTYASINENLMVKSGLILKEITQTDRGLLNHGFYVKNAFVEGVSKYTEKVLISLLTIRSGKFSMTAILTALLNPIFIFFVLSSKLNSKVRYADLFFVTEQVPNPNSKVTLSEKLDKRGYPIAKISWQLSQRDLDSVDEFIDVLESSGFDEGYISHLDKKDRPDWNSSLTSAAHHLGTARMSDSFATGVVNKDLLVFGSENFFVCDGSVFPTSGNANSSFTVAALSCRLAEHLISRTQSTKKNDQLT